MNLLDIFAGKKTYVIGVALIAYAIGGFISGNLSQEIAITSFMTGIGLITSRRAVNR